MTSSYGDKQPVEVANRFESRVANVARGVVRRNPHFGDTVTNTNRRHDERDKTIIALPGSNRLPMS